MTSTDSCPSTALGANDPLGGLLLSMVASIDEHEGPIESAARAVAAVAETAAKAVDEEARFPSESVAAMREQRLLAALVPRELGGLGATVAEVASAVRIIAGSCASSALVLAMHSIEVANLCGHGATDELRALLAEVGRDQLLVANANSEVGIGGDVGRSLCALEPSEGAHHLVKAALAISYGSHADVVVATARRSPESTETDQVLVACRPPGLVLTPISTWDSTGLRGTCSVGFQLEATIEPGFVFPHTFATIANRGGGQLRQILLSATWVGIAEAAAERAHAFVRKAARRQPGNVPISAIRLTELAIEVQQARSLLASEALWYEAVAGTDAVEAPELVMALRSLKVATSRLAVEAATCALGICGIEGYRRDSPLSLDRILRDAHGGVVMVSNDRHLLDNAQLLCATKRL